MPHSFSRFADEHERRIAAQALEIHGASVWNDWAPQVIAFLREGMTEEEAEDASADTQNTLDKLVERVRKIMKDVEDALEEAL